MLNALRLERLAACGAKGTTRLVLFVLAAHADAGGAASLSLCAIAEGVGCNERTVRRCLDKLKQSGDVVVDFRAAKPDPDEATRARVNTYHIRRLGVPTGGHAAAACDATRGNSAVNGIDNRGTNAAL